MISAGGSSTNFPRAEPEGFSDLNRRSKIRFMKHILRERKTKTPNTVPAAAPTPAKDDPPKYTPRGGKKERILIAVKDDRIDFTAMSSDSSKALNELFHRPEVQAQFGIGPLTQGFDPQHCKRLYQGLGILMIGTARSLFRWPTEAALKLAYTPEEQEELSKPTATVLDELAPAWIREHQSLAALMTVFSAITYNHLRDAQAEMIRIRREAVNAAAGVPPDVHPPAPQVIVTPAPPGSVPIPIPTPGEPGRVRIPIAIVTNKPNGAAAAGNPPDNPPSFGGGGPNQANVK